MSLYDLLMVVPTYQRIDVWDQNESDLEPIYSGPAAEITMEQLVGRTVEKIFPDELEELVITLASR